MRLNRSSLCLLLVAVISLAPYEVGGDYVGSCYHAEMFGCECKNHQHHVLMNLTHLYDTVNIHAEAPLFSMMMFDDEGDTYTVEYKPCGTFFCNQLDSEKRPLAFCELNNHGLPNKLVFHNEAEMVTEVTSGEFFLKYGDELMIRLVCDKQYAQVPKLVNDNPNKTKPKNLPYKFSLHSAYACWDSEEK